jgi:SAM-dependent methyltransferase
VAFTDPRALAAGPYRTPDPLSARAAIYAWQRPTVDLVGAAVAVLAELSQRALVVDVGCGPGRLLGRLRVARPDLRCLGIDVSTGMLRAVEDAQVLRAVGSADALPVRPQSADAAVAMHMLYHLPDPQAGLAELRRVIQPGGCLVVSANDHDADGLWQLFVDAGLHRDPVSARWPLGGAAAAVRAAGFDDVHPQVFDYELDIPGAQPILAYFDSCRNGCPDMDEQAWQNVRRTVADTVATLMARHGALRRTGRTGLVVAR